MYENLVIEEIKKTGISSRFHQLRKFKQHGNVSVYEHCVSVAYMSLKIAKFLRLNVNYVSLVRGALLHDYYFYDWHEKDSTHSLHGFKHPRRVVNNAGEDFELSDLETNIILRHMFPLTIVPPKHIESWVVCMADKICAAKETISRR